MIGFISLVVIMAFWPNCLKKRGNIVEFFVRNIYIYIYTYLYIYLVSCILFAFVHHRLVGSHRE